MYLDFNSCALFLEHLQMCTIKKKLNLIWFLLVLSIILPEVAPEVSDESECNIAFNAVWRNTSYFKEKNGSHSDIHPRCFINKPKNLNYECIDHETISVNSNYSGEEFSITCTHSKKMNFKYDGTILDNQILIFKSPIPYPGSGHFITYTFNISSSSTGKYTVTSESGLSTSIYIFCTNDGPPYLLGSVSPTQPLKLSLSTKSNKDWFYKSTAMKHHIIPCRSSSSSKLIELFDISSKTTPVKLDWHYDPKIGFHATQITSLQNSSVVMCTADYPINNDVSTFEIILEANKTQVKSFRVKTSPLLEDEMFLEDEEDEESIIKFELKMSTCFGRGSARFHSVVNIQTYNPSESKLYKFIDQDWVEKWIQRNDSRASFPLDRQVKVELCNGAQWCNINDIFPTGIILCIGHDGDLPVILRREYFTCLHGVKFPYNKRDSVSFPLEALLQMKIVSGTAETSKEEDVPQEIIVDCITAKYLFLYPNKWYLKYESNATLQLQPEGERDSAEYIHEFPNKNIQRRVFKINSENATEIMCEATFWDSVFTKTHILTIPKKIKPSEGYVSWIFILGVSSTIIVFGAAVALFIYQRFHSKPQLGFSDAQIRDFLEGNPKAISDGETKKGELLPYDKNVEISEGRYEIFRNIILGSGAFGVVYQGVVDNVTVAVKTVKIHCATNEYLAALLSELKIMIHLGKHENIVNLIGASTKELKIGKVYVFVEHCLLGSLDNYLKANKGKLREGIRSGHVSENGYTLKDLVNWSFQIARGMEYLFKKQVIHGDLATRNVLLSDRNTIKISDFGLSCKLYNYKHYVKKTDSFLIPWRWMSIEALTSFSFSCQSDVWSYGITLFEIFSLGQIPYMCLSYDECFIKKLSQGLRNHKPTYATEEIYDVMKQCWHKEPHLRPSFTNLRIFFNNLLTAWAKESVLSPQASAVPYVMVENELGYTMLAW